MLSIIVPCFNEESSLPLFFEETEKVKDQVGMPFEYLFINDGSSDQTLAVMRKLHQEHPESVRYLSFSRNFGKEAALYAGLKAAKGDFVTVMDADLQDDIDAIDQFVQKYYEGNDIVYGVRSSRETDTFFKRFTAQSFYKVMKTLGVDIVYNHADYRLMSKRALNELEQFKEVNLFLRGIVPLIGFSSDIVTYERHERFAGESKYPLKKMLSFAFDGITSFSIKPIRMITTLGILIFSVSILMLLYFLILYFLDKTVAGWSTIVISIWAIGGLQLLAIGIIGEYIGKIYLEAKSRPKFIVETFLQHRSDHSSQ